MTVRDICSELGDYRRTNRGSSQDHTLVKARKEFACECGSTVNVYDAPQSGCAPVKVILPGDVYLRTRVSWLDSAPVHIDCAIRAGLVETIVAPPAECENGQANTCRHDSASGMDASFGPGKVWRCDHCGLCWIEGYSPHDDRAHGLTPS